MRFTKSQDDAIASLIELAHFATTDELLKSRMDCHAKNVSSIVLRDTNGRLLRAFLAWPGHRLFANRPGHFLEVGIHNHRYDIALSLIAGWVENVVYTRDDFSWPGSHLLREWKFTSGVANGSPVAECVGEARACASSRTRLDYGQKTLLDADTLHTIECVGVAGWFVEEGEEKRKQTTLLTTAAEIDTAGLYVPFESRRAVLDHISDWCMKVAA